MLKKMLMASTGSLVLGVALVLPAIGAAPTYSGTLYCDRASDGQYEALNTLSGATRQDIGSWRRYWTVETGYCAKGSLDTSQLTQDA